MSDSQRPKKANSFEQRREGAAAGRPDARGKGTGALGARRFADRWAGFGQALGRAGRRMRGAGADFWRSPGWRWTAAAAVLFVFVGVGFAVGRWSVLPELWRQAPPVAVKSPADAQPLSDAQSQAGVKPSGALLPQPDRPAPKTPVKPPTAGTPAASAGRTSTAGTSTAGNSTAGTSSASTPAASASAARTATASPAPASSEQPAAVATAGGRATATTNTATANSATMNTATASGVASDAPPRMLVWPASGKVTRPYGWQKSEFGDWRLTSTMTLSGTSGRAVYAVLDGQVSQVLPDGVVVKHANGWISHYSSLSLVTVSQGQQVAQGAVVGRAAGDLKFALFHGAAAVNPSLYLP